MICDKDGPPLRAIFALSGTFCGETAADLKSAIEKAYERVESVHFDNAFYRHDIGQRALKALEH